MTGRIRILDEITANQIAAGEVVERPASVVKELVENSIDAGGTRITIELKEGGLEEISVMDNGRGMSRDDAQIAFQRHATSKISSLEDLNTLVTLGFRGEALASIASVSKIELVTREKDDLSGTKVLIEGGQLLSIEDIGSPSGTKIHVRNLFFNTPARKKHLKSLTTELSHVTEVTQKLALGNPHVAIKLLHNNKTIINSLGTGKLSDGILSLYGLETLNHVKYIKKENALYTLEGYIGLPLLARNNRNHQSFFINGRYVKSKVMSTTLEEGFHTLLPNKKYPFALLYLYLNPALVDINVHPTKMEVRFSEEEALSSLIIDATKEALKEPKLIPIISELETREQKNQSEDQKSLDPKNLYQQKGSEYHQQIFELKTVPRPREAFNLVREKGETFKELIPPKVEPRVESKVESEVASKVTTQVEPEKDTALDIPNSPPPKTLLPDLHFLGQFDSSYILAQGQGGLYIIDQHAAHERILYEEFLVEPQSEIIQELLIPSNIELTFRESNLVIENILLFRDLGYIIEHFGGQTFVLRGIPSGLEIEDGRSLFFEILDSLIDKGDFKKSNLREKYLIMRACKSAIKANQYLAQPLIEELIYKLSQCENPFTCPHGRPTIINLTRSELDKRFKRTT